MTSSHPSSRQRARLLLIPCLLAAVSCAKPWGAHVVDASGGTEASGQVVFYTNPVMNDLPYNDNVDASGWVGVMRIPSLGERYSEYGEPLQGFKASHFAQQQTYALFVKLPPGAYQGDFVFPKDHNRSAGDVFDSTSPGENHFPVRFSVTAGMIKAIRLDARRVAQFRNTIEYQVTSVDMGSLGHDDLRYDLSAECSPAGEDGAQKRWLGTFLTAAFRPPRSHPSERQAIGQMLSTFRSDNSLVCRALRELLETISKAR